MLSEDNFEEAWAYQEIIAKGREKGLHEGLHKGELLALRGVIVDIVQRRFPPLVTLVSSHIQKMEDATQLHHLSVELSIAQTVQEAEQAFKAIAKDAQQH